MLRCLYAAMGMSVLPILMMMVPDKTRINMMHSRNTYGICDLNRCSVFRFKGDMCPHPDIAM